MNQIDELDSLSTQILPRCSVQTFRISMYKRWTTTLKTMKIFIDHSLIKQNPVANPCIICISHQKLRLPPPFISTITIILYSQGAANWAPKWPWSCLQWSLSQPVGLQPMTRGKPLTFHTVISEAHDVVFASEQKWQEPLVTLSFGG